jgi:hypothetical protein
MYFNDPTGNATLPIIAFQTLTLSNRYPSLCAENLLPNVVNALAHLKDSNIVV